MQEIDKKRHSLSHLLAMAILEKFPRAKLGIGPVIENGFYYDFDGIKISDEDLKNLEGAMLKLINKNIKFEKKIITPKEAEKLFKDQPYKLELIREFKKGKKTISIYKSDNFIDLCSGPHVKNTKEINPKSFKLIKTAGAYWRGDEKNKMLTRIYGLYFDKEEELNDYLKSLEYAQKCDHRTLGERLNIFMVDEEIGKGLPLLLPQGYLLRRRLEDYIYNLERENGYQHVLTPVLAKEDLYKKSGHLAHYRDDMYSPIEIENEKYYLKPMNCPHHHSIYKRNIRSYKDLPLRLAEFGHVHRYERSGVLTGLIRVRGFTQNDSHIYMKKEDLEKEIENVLKMAQKVYRDFKITDYWYRLSLPDFKNKEKYGDIKNKKMWSDGSNVLKRALKNLGHKFTEAIGEATFYGPKIDIQIKNILGKEDTIGTVQVDYYSASRFNLFYIDKDGKEKPVVIVHRAIMGSFERFMAFLLEKTCGNLPLWISPIQVKIIPVGEKFNDYGENILKKLRENGIYAEIDKENETLGKRIRNAEIQKIPYILVIGEREKNEKTVSVRESGMINTEDDNYKKQNIGVMPFEKFIEKIKKEIEEKR